MQCYNCGADLTEKNFCTNCGQMFLRYKKLLSFPIIIIMTVWIKPVSGIFPVRSRV